MSSRLDSILNDIKQYADDAYDDGYSGGYDEGWMPLEKAIQIH